MQSSSLVIQLLSRVEARLIEYYTSTLSRSDLINNGVTSNNENQLAAYLASSFEVWVHDRMQKTTDHWFRRVINFYLIARDYRMHKEAVRNGDTLALESLLQNNLYVWICVGKTKCFEEALCTFETLYDKAPYWLLQGIRENRTGKLYKGTNALTGLPTADRAWDELMELIQHKYKSMHFPANEDTWEAHSYNLSMMQQSETFALHHYVKRTDVASSDAYNTGKGNADNDCEDRGQRKKVTVASRRRQEKIMIDEILTLSNIVTEIPDRQFNENMIWEVLAKTTTELKASTESENEEQQEEDALSMMVDAVDEMRQVLRTQNDDQHGEQIQISTALLDEETEEEETSNVGETTVVVGKRTHRLIKVNPNELAGVFVHGLGKEKMEKMNLPLRRTRKKERKARERKALHENLYEFIIGFIVDAENAEKQLESTMRAPMERNRRNSIVNQLNRM